MTHRPDIAPASCATSEARGEASARRRARATVRSIPSGAARGLFVFVLLAFGSVFAHAAVDWRFEPAADVGVRNTDNVQIATATREESDTIISAAISLAWTGRGPRSQFSFLYEPRRDFYNDFSDLDSTSHRVRLGWRHQASARAEWTAELSGSQSEDPQLYLDTATLDTVAVPRTERTDLSGSLGARFAVSPLSAVLVRGSVRATSYDQSTLTGADLDGDGTGDIAPLLVTDSSSVGIEAGWERALARDASFYAGYRGSAIDEEFRGDATVHRVEVGYRKGTPDRVQFGARLGAGRRDDDSATPGTGDDTDFIGQLTLAGGVGREGRFEFGAGRDLRGSSGTSGVAVNDSIYGTLAVPTSQWSDIGIFARWAERDPVRTASSIDTTQTTSFGASWTAMVAPQWLVVLSTSRIEQDSNLSGDPRNADYASYYAGVRWRLRDPARGAESATGS